MNNSFIQSIMNMSADIYIQQVSQNPNNGAIQRDWLFQKTVHCKIEPLKTRGSSSRSDNKTFDNGKYDEYSERLQLKMKLMEPVSKRWRISGIRTNNGKKVYTEIDRYDNPDTIFDITASHAVLDPFGNISYYEVTLQRVEIQNDQTTVK